MLDNSNKNNNKRKNYNHDEKYDYDGLPAMQKLMARMVTITALFYKHNVITRAINYKTGLTEQDIKDVVDDISGVFSANEMPRVSDIELNLIVAGVWKSNDVIARAEGV